MKIIILENSNTVQETTSHTSHNNFNNEDKCTFTKTDQSKQIYNKFPQYQSFKKVHLHYLVEIKQPSGEILVMTIIYYMELCTTENLENIVVCYLHLQYLKSKHLNKNKFITKESQKGYHKHNTCTGTKSVKF